MEDRGTIGGDMSPTRRLAARLPREAKPIALLGEPTMKRWWGACVFGDTPVESDKWLKFGGVEAEWGCIHPEDEGLPK